MDTFIHKIPLYITLAALAGFGLVHGANNNVTGCETVGCPLNQTCTIVNNTLDQGIGVAPILSENTSFPSLSWIQGSYALTSPKVVYGENYYLATPQGQSLGDNDTKACAVFFRHFNAVFPGPFPETAISTGTCPDAIQQSCIDALTKRAASLHVSNETDACGALQQSFESNLDNECAEYAFGNKWQNVTATSLTSPQPISEEQNLSSNSWPIQPRSDNLALVDKFLTTINDLEYLENDTYRMTPILSVFYPGSGSIVSSPEAQLTCLKVVGFSENLGKESTGMAPKAVATSFTRLLLGAAVVIVTSRVLSGRT